MQINFLNPVLRACNNVMVTMAGLELQAGKPYKLKPHTPVSGKSVTGLISMHSRIRRASVAIVFSEAALINTAEKMLPQKQQIIDSVAIDLVGELSNMILGGTKGMLEEEGYDFDMSLPTVMIGHDYFIPHQTNSPIVRIPFASSGGAFYVEASFEGPAIPKKVTNAIKARKAARNNEPQPGYDLF